MSSKAVLYTDSGFHSPYAMSAYVALKEKGADFELVKVDLAHGAQRQPEYLELSLTGKVPMLVHDGFALSESSAITEYIDDIFEGPAIYPRDVRQRARTRQIQAWLRTDLASIRQERPSDNLFARSTTPLPALSATAREAADRLIGVADRLLPHGASDLFDTWSIADFELSLMLNRMVAVGDPMPSRLADYVHHQWSRPSVQGWVALYQKQAG